MFDCIAAVVSEVHLETGVGSLFERCAAQRYQSAILRRNIEDLESVKKEIVSLIGDVGELNILIPASDTSVEIPRTNLDPALQEELNLMLSVSRHTSGGGVKRLQIRQAFFRESHPHGFSVVNCNWNSMGTKIKTKGEPAIAKEGDLAYIGRGILHSSYPDLRENKITVAVFNA
jgi:hypothetical protein